jgi:hypothetical protein
METINSILDNMKIIMENMSHTLEEMKNFVNEIIEEQIEKAVLEYLKERGFHQNQIPLQEGHQKIPFITKTDPKGEGQSTSLTFKDHSHSRDTCYCD